MAMTKIIDPSGWDFHRPVSMMVKLSSRGLVGNDRSDFIKLAGHAFLDVIDNIKVAKDEVPVHTIALGATEFYGPNRNGDGFKEATCRAHHKTFEKYARWYRNHKNKDPRLSYGYIKLAAYHEAMHRVELLAMLNATKEAAERNGGLVADKELEKLGRGEDLATSMACRVPFDVCSGCDHHARTRDEYCTHRTCKYGGCRENLAKLAADGHVLHVDNPEPVWFDESHVYRPADRIAYGARADWLDKAASHQFLPGAEMADMLGVTAPLHVCLAADDTGMWPGSVAGRMKLAKALAVVEDLRNDGLGGETFRGLDPRGQSALNDVQLSQLGHPGTEKAAASLAALADRRIFLPLRDFARWYGKQASAKAAGRWLPGAYRRLVERGDLGQTISRGYDLGLAKAASLAVQSLAATVAPELSLAPSFVRERSMRSAIRGLGAPELNNGIWNEKQAADDPDAATLAEEYAVYKLAALYRIAETDGDFHLTARLAVGQNKVF